MDHNVIEVELVGRDPGMCVCKGGASLDILKDIQKIYEERMERVDQIGGQKKLQMQVNLLRSWVSDLISQNTLLAQAVEELETEATTRLLVERRRHNELLCEARAECASLRRRLARKDADLRGVLEVVRRLREFDCCALDGIHFFEVTESDIFGPVDWRPKTMEQGDGRRAGYKQRGTKRKICGCGNDLKQMNDSLHKENVAKDREIMRLNKDVQSYEQTIMNLRNELSFAKYHTPDVSTKDAEVMAGMCCTGAEVPNTCGEWEPVKDCGAEQREETVRYQERIHKMEISLKSSGSSVRALRQVNASLGSELAGARRVLAALDAQCRAATLRAHFKDDIIREMRRQLKQAKTKLKETAETQNVPPKDYMSGDQCRPTYSRAVVSCVRQQPRRACLALGQCSEGGASTRRDGSGDDGLSMTP